MRVVLALDRCTDDTASLARAEIGNDGRFEIVEIDACPSDWVGKVHGTLEFAAGSSDSAVPRAALPDHGVSVRSRSGGERIQLAPGGPARALKRILQEAAMPLWLRDSLPLVFCGEVLAVVPGIGVAVAFHAAPGAPGYAVSWHPAARQG